MYCPPESGNMEPSSANATQAHSEITPPSTHTRKNSVGLGKGPAISLAVRKIEEPMMPLTSSSTESSRLSPRTRLGFGAEGSGSVAGEAVSIVVGRLRCWSLVACRSAQRHWIPLGFANDQRLATNDRSYPMPSSSGDSSGVPQRRQMTAKQ